MLYNYLSVSELIGRLNQAIEAYCAEVLFEGEISEIKTSTNGHIYLSLKDAASQISAVIWRSTAVNIKIPLSQGLSVRCLGKPTIYPASGRLQVIIQKIELSGEGVLRKKFLELKARLEKEGLFDSARKRQIPRFPKKIGIVTSKTGAALQDILAKLKERMPNVNIYFYDVRVQGVGAAEEIAAAIQTLNDQISSLDLIILARGGGSLEDLWAFNEELVARAVFASRVPIISGVGHETDTTLCDLVADLRAPTPTAAAVTAVPDRKELLARIINLEKQLFDLDLWFYQFSQRLDNSCDLLESQSISILELCAARLRAAKTSLLLLDPAATVAAWRLQINSLLDNLSLKFENFLDLNKEKADSLASLLEEIRPHGILKRGYAMIKQGTTIVSRKKTLQTKNSFQLVFYDGVIDGKVI
ncbi:MAG TPA: exodeoxyribonuclease VII large subunit [Oligoflexia bacterium]|nr:exodeoxyribonuclease VII large subunit [Oligoflexia bacterium]HMP26658.1 exodeoxyribonuclease VII large subunit [Oligoflexia bacterium]